MAKADSLVWLDMPRRTVMRRVVVRTIRRVATREELWNGNREPCSNLYSKDPEKNLVVWAWTRYDHVRDKYEQGPGPMPGSIDYGRQEKSSGFWRPSRLEPPFHRTNLGP